MATFLGFILACWTRSSRMIWSVEAWAVANSKPVVMRNGGTILMMTLTQVWSGVWFTRSIERIRSPSEEVNIVRDIGRHVVEARHGRRRGKPRRATLTLDSSLRRERVTRIFLTGVGVLCAHPLATLPTLSPSTHTLAFSVSLYLIFLSVCSSQAPLLSPDTSAQPD